MLLIWILMIVVVVWVVRAAARQDRQGSDKTPGEILDECYARGEIDEAAYRRRREEIER